MKPTALELAVETTDEGSGQVIYRVACAVYIYYTIPLN